VLVKYSKCNDLVQFLFTSAELTTTYYYYYYFQGKKKKFSEDAVKLKVYTVVFYNLSLLLRCCEGQSSPMIKMQATKNLT
jgi:hypothetical protein